MKAKEALHAIVDLIHAEVAKHQHAHGNDLPVVHALREHVEKLSAFADIDIPIRSVGDDGKKQKQSS